MEHNPEAINSRGAFAKDFWESEFHWHEPGF